jgi:hypothetical protein
VQVWAVRDSYHGDCPPPEAEAPAFSGSFTVGRTPASVRYRWVTQSGAGSDAGWKTLDFAAGDPKTKEVHHTLTSFQQAGEHHDSVRVEVSRPVKARSGWVPFSVTCRAASPSSEPPSYPSTSPPADDGTSQGTGSGPGTQSTELSTGR